jgi:hypothetical protein
LDVRYPRAKLADFVPHDPDEAGCVIELHQPPFSATTKRGGAERGGAEWGGAMRD